MLVGNDTVTYSAGRVGTKYPDILELTYHTAVGI